MTHKANFEIINNLLFDVKGTVDVITRDPDSQQFIFVIFLKGSDWQCIIVELRLQYY